jgi:tetratricopeptide (TPR) repeat protein
MFLQSHLNMKAFIITLLVTFAWNIGYTQYQDKNIDYLKHQLSIAQADTTRVLLMASLCYNFSSTNPDSAELLGKQAIAQSRKINFKKGEALALTNLGRHYGNRGEASKALKLLFDALQISLAYQFRTQTALSLNFIGTTYNALQQYPTAKYYFLKSEETAKGLQVFWQLALDLNIGEVYRSLNLLDSAQIYLKKAENEYEHSSIAGSEQIRLLNLMGQIQYDLGNHQPGLDTLRKSYSLATSPRMIAHAGASPAGACWPRVPRSASECLCSSHVSMPLSSSDDL